MSDIEVSPRPRIQEDTSSVDQVTATDPLASDLLSIGEAYTHPQIGYACLLQDLRSSVPILLSDLAGILLAWSATFWICQLIGNEAAPGYRSLLALVFAVPVGFLVLRLYPAATTHPALEIQTIVVGIALIFIGLFASIFYTERPESAMVHRSIHFLVMIMCIPVLRMLTRGLCSRFSWWRQPTLIMGSDDEIEMISNWINAQWYLGIRPVKYIMSNSLLKHPTHVIVAPDAAFAANFDGDVSWSYPRTIFVPEMLLQASGLGFSISAGTMAGGQSQNKLCSPFQQSIKRLIDLGLIFLFLPILVPTFAVLILLVRFSSTGPVFYRQPRLGRNRQRFGVWKFRTMIENADAMLEHALEQDPALRAEWDRDRKLKCDPRVTRIGRMLRRTSLDELPQLFNVICGQMSLVGPRPLPVGDETKYESEFRDSVSNRSRQSQYERVTPGLTGLWQISGRNNTSYQERIELDEFYIRNWSVWLDFFILFRTIKTVLFREGAY